MQQEKHKGLLSEEEAMKHHEQQNVVPGLKGAESAGAQTGGGEKCECSDKEAAKKATGIGAQQQQQQPISSQHQQQQQQPHHKDDEAQMSKSVEKWSGATGAQPQAHLQQGAGGGGVESGTQQHDALKRLLGDSFLTANNEKVSFNDVIKDKKLILVYFSAGWCGSCRQFTPVLKQVWDTWKNVPETHKDVTCIWASLDGDEASFEEYRAHHGDYLAFPFQDTHVELLKQKLEVHGIPALYAFSANGELLAKDVKNRITRSHEEGISELLEQARKICSQQCQGQSAQGHGSATGGAAGDIDAGAIWSTTGNV